MATARPENGLAEHAYLCLRQAILDHRFEPGERLSVAVVAERLEVGRSPAREAIARVTYEGLAQFEPNKGAVVANPDRGELVEIYEVREVLEGLACRLASQRISAADLRDLRTILADQRAAIDSGDVARHYIIDMRFHARIREIAANSKLANQLDLLQDQIRLAMSTTHRSPGGMPLALAEHHRIVDALESKDVLLAEFAGRGHIARLRNELAIVEAKSTISEPSAADPLL